MTLTVGATIFNPLINIGKLSARVKIHNKLECPIHYKLCAEHWVGYITPLVCNVGLNRSDDRYSDCNCFQDILNKSLCIWIVSHVNNLVQFVRRALVQNA